MVFKKNTNLNLTKIRCSNHISKLIKKGNKIMTNFLLKTKTEQFKWLSEREREREKTRERERENERERERERERTRERENERERERTRTRERERERERTRTRTRDTGSDSGGESGGASCRALHSFPCFNSKFTKLIEGFFICHIINYTGYNQK